MGKISHAKPIWLWGGCSEKAFLSDLSEVTPNTFVERLSRTSCENLKYFQFNFNSHKHMETFGRINDKFVQETVLFEGDIHD
jgi:hypothetical protein